jgi:hypothetical protein
MNNTTPQTDYSLPKDGYIAFDAMSLRNLIIKRLNDQGIFTDQNYLGSNLSCIIDIVSYVFHTLIYYLHRTSSEATFTEAQLVENINKIVKLLDYKPIGYQTSTLPFICRAPGNFPVGGYTIPRYSYITVGNLPFSFGRDASFVISQTSAVEQEITELSNNELLYQGVFQEYPLYSAAGDEHETVVINRSDVIIDHFSVDVYVWESERERWYQYKEVPTTYVEAPNARIFEKRLNSNGLYEVSFGDGIAGRRLVVGDRVAIYYLQSFGANGVIGPRSAQTATKSFFASTQYTDIIQDVVPNIESLVPRARYQSLLFDNAVGSTIPRDFESVDSIRNNAPASFKSQYRVVTKEDYETYIRTNFANFISDVRVLDNWQYMSNYLSYFERIGVGSSNFRQILFNQVQYADSCNFNNVYICSLPRVSSGTSLKYLVPAQKELIKTDIEKLKTINAEISFVDPVYKAFDIGIPDSNGDFAVSDSEFCVLEVLKERTSLRASQSITNDVVRVFNEMLNVSNVKLGAPFPFSEITTRLLSIDGVTAIRTKRTDTNRTLNGLHLFVWNPIYSSLDYQTCSSDLAMEPYEAFYFNGIANLYRKIQIIPDK